MTLSLTSHLAGVFAAVALAAPAGKMAQGSMMKGKKMGMAAPASAKTIVVNTCPTTGGKVVGAGVGMSRVASYEVHFCCAGCKPEFDKLSKAAQLQKIRAVLAKS